MTAPRIAIIGRPNVGKSSIFNRLVGYQAALVHNQPGITRDRKYGYIQRGDQELELIDTAGFEEGERADLARRMNDISMAAMAESVAVIFVIDGAAGVTPADESLARLVQRANRPVIFVMNKGDTKAAHENIHETYSLGFDEPVMVSAAHNAGFGELMEKIWPYAAPKAEVDVLLPDELENLPEDLEEAALIEDEVSEPVSMPLPEVMRLAIVGRPNAGKSTLVNQLLGHARMLAGPEAGLTRESVSSRWEYDGQLYELLDTPGLRRKARITDKVEQMSASDALDAVRRAHVVVLVVDATQPLEHQDKTIAELVLDDGKPLVIALNKWDLVDAKEELLTEVAFMMERGLAQVKNIPLVPISAISGTGIKDLFPPIQELYRLWNIRIGTGQLNRFLAGAVAAHQPALTKDHKSVKMKFMAQVRTRPPTFHVWCNRPQAVQPSYVRYLTNGLRETFGLHGIVLRVHTTTGKNPYATDR